MLVVAPVVFKAGLFKLLEGTVFFPNTWWLLRNHVHQIPAQLHCVSFTGLPFCLRKMN